MNKIIGVDPGSAQSGLISLTGASINWSAMVKNTHVASRIGTEILTQGCIVVIEDIKPFSLRITKDIIETCKFIGELKYRLEIVAGASVRLVARSEVRKWIFEQFHDISDPLIKVKMQKKGVQKASHYMWVDDFIVRDCMKFLYKIPDPKPGKGYQFGLKSHNFQALALASFVSSTAEK